MRHVLTVLTVLCCSVSISFAQLYEVGDSPAFVWSGDNVNVLCLQVDQNFDGVQDPEDALASWWRVLPDGSTEMVREFSWQADYLQYPFGFPVRPAFTESRDTVFLYVENGVSAFDVVSGEQVGRIEVGGQVSGLLWQRDGTLFCSVRGDEHVLRAYTWSSGEMLGEFEVVDYPQQLSFVRSGNKTWLSVLSEGSWGESGAVQFLDTETFEMTSILADPLPNAIHTVENNVFVVLNGLAEVWEIDPVNTEVVRKYSVTEAVQPRDILFRDNRMFVVSYDGGIAVYELPSGEYVGRVLPDGRPESAAWHEGELWVANTYLKESFVAGNTVQRMNLTADIAEETQSEFLTMPNPSGAAFEISHPSSALNQETVRVFDVRGKLVATSTLEPASSGVSTQMSLPTGVYLIVVGTNSTVHTVQ